METPKERYKANKITFNEMLREIRARAFSTFTSPKKWALLRAQKEGVDIDNSPYLDGSENADEEHYDRSARYRENLRDVEKSLKTQ